MRPVGSEAMLGEGRRLASRLLAERTPVAEVERSLVGIGFDAAAATTLVDGLLAERLAQTAPQASPSPRWVRILVGFTVAAVGFCWAYSRLSSEIGRGTWGPINARMVPGAGLAVAGLNVVRTELMKLLG